MAVVIEFEHVVKAYRVAKQRPFLAREIVRRILQLPSRVERVVALRDVSFTIEAGEAVGVIGSNGSGKSTLLSLIARTSYPTQGRVRVEGRVGPLLELGAGFHPDLTGRENIYLNASLLGLTRDEVEERFDAIVGFAEIGDFLDAPLRTYSTGMAARLGFAVIAHVDPEILLVDEALSVGDAKFQKRCHEAIEGFLTRGKTLVLVSHDVGVVEKLCARAIWIESGELRMDGAAKDVCLEYWNWSQRLAAS